MLSEKGEKLYLDSEKRLRVVRDDQFFMTPSMMGIGHRKSGGRRRSSDKLGRYHKHAWGRGGRLSQRDGAGAAPLPGNGRDLRLL